MSAREKAAYYRALKESGLPLAKHYRDYTTAELKEAYAALDAQGAAPPITYPDPPPPPRAQSSYPDPRDRTSGGMIQEMRDPYAGQPAAPRPPEPEFKFDPEATARAMQEMAASAPPPPPPPPTQEQFRQEVQQGYGDTPMRPVDPQEYAAQRLNEQQDEPIRIDPETGWIWYQEEIVKPAFPKPRARRVLTYTDSGSKQVTVQNGQYLESFEVAGDEQRMGQVKITLPSYQVGIYKDPRLPFKIHVYNELRGFHFNDVIEYYGGAELVPPSVKRIYVENVLCFDIPSVVRAINDEYRHHQLTGRL